MRRLIISNTHYQTIVSLQLRLTLFKEDDVVFLVSDHSNGSKEIVERFNKIRVFEDVKYIQTRDIINNNTKRGEWEDFFCFTFSKKNKYDFYLNDIKNLYFDELVVYNFNFDIYGLYSVLSSVNPQIKISMMEEGILSYSKSQPTPKKLALSGKIRNGIGKKNIENAVGNFYCFYPCLYEGKYRPVQIPLIRPKSEIVEILKEVFDVQAQDLHYDRKYIFFASVFDFEGGTPIGEFELVKQIADTVGKDNLLIKIHPRDRRTVYHDNGFMVDRNSSVPWEVIQLSHDFSNHVFLTATSGSVLSGNFLTDIPVRTYYLFDLCHIQGSAAENIVQQIYNLLRNENVKETFQSVQVARSIEEIL